MTTLQECSSIRKLLPLSTSRLGAGLRLFCLPSAGGGAVMFRNWLSAAGEDLEVHPLELPGRGARSGDPPAADLERFAGELAAEMLPLVSQPFAIFGHSFGAMLGFELAAQLTREGFEPVHLFVSACRPPHLPPRLRLHTFDNDRLLNYLHGLGGISDALLDEPDVLAYFLPVIRADLYRFESYCHKPAECVLRCPVTALAGAGDRHVVADEMAGWRHFTQGSFRFERFSGGHFFITSDQQSVIRLVRNRLLEKPNEK